MHMLQFVSTSDTPTHRHTDTHTTRSLTHGCGIRVLVFDDSFEHEVWNRADAERTVLIIDLWQPALSREARETVRKRMKKRK